ncbi:MAG: glycosyltransferase family 2 protein [Syntrophobacteraceae bacterium]
MSGRTLISVIVPTYNRKNYIAGAVESVIAQRIDDLEIIVVDDGSSDDTRGVLTAYLHSIRYFYQENRGVSAARNLGVSKANGKLLAFLDSDDLWTPGKLSAQLHNVTSENTLSFHGVEWFVDGQEDSHLLKGTNTAKWPRCRPDGFVADPILDVAEGRYLQLGTLLCSKDAFQKVGPFDEDLSYGEDEDWFSRAASRMKFHYSAEAFLRIRYHSYQTSQTSEKSIRSLIKVFERMKARTRGVHSRAYAAANQRLASKWSHLANVLASQARRQEAARAALTAFCLEPAYAHRLVKAGLMLAGWRSK